jgi:predicted nucleotidyltransferase
MDKSEVVAKLIKYKALVSEYFDIDSVILYGSYAVGNPREESDIDVAVVVNSIDEAYFTYAPLLWKLRRQVDDRIEPVLVEKDKDKSGFLQEIMRTGLVIA